MDDARQIGRGLISDADFNHLLMDTLAWASEYMEGEEVVMPHALAFYTQPDGRRNLAVLASPGWEDNESKNRILAGMGVEAADCDDPLAAVFLVTEAWMSQRTAEEGPPGVPPSQDPERVEVIIISGSTLDQRQNQAIVTIERQNGRMHAGEVTAVPYIDDGRDEIQNKLVMQFLLFYSLATLARRKGRPAEN